MNAVDMCWATEEVKAGMREEVEQFSREEHD